MKHLFYTIICLSLAIICQAQQPTKPLITKRTATWCPNCGTWGWDAMKGLVDDLHGEKATVLALHHSGDLSDALNIALADNFPTNGQPIFMVDGVDINFTSSSWETKLEDLKTTIDSNPNTISRFVIEEAYYHLLVDTPDEIYARVSYDISDQPDGEYSIGGYIVRDNILANQAGLGGNLEHYKIVDGSFTVDPFGVEISSDGEVMLTHEVFTALDFSDFIDQEVAFILWRKDGESYIPITTETAILSTVVSNTDDLSIENTNLKVFQDNAGNIQCSVSGQNHVDGVFALYNLAGQQIAQKTNAHPNVTFYQEEIPQAGVYIVKYNTGEYSISQKLSVN